MSKEHVVETDVLVIAGCFAGTFVAINAKEKEVKVTLMDKGYVSNSGISPYAGTHLVFNHGWGHKLDFWMNRINTHGE